MYNYTTNKTLETNDTLESGGDWNVLLLEMCVWTELSWHGGVSDFWCQEGFTEISSVWAATNPLERAPERGVHVGQEVSEKVSEKV